jgi:hypothetical protein
MDLKRSLATMEDSDREGFAGYVSKYPDLKNGFLRQSDYSKRLDEVSKAKNEFEVALNGLQAWEAENVESRLEDGTIITKAEAAYRDRAAQLEQELSRAKETEMTFEDLNKHLDTKIGELGVVKKSDFESILGTKEAEINRNFDGYAKFATQMPAVMLRHFKETGEILDPDKFVAEEIVAKKQFDIGRAYEEYYRPTREAKQAAEIEARVKAAREEGSAEARKNFVMSNEGRMPTDSTGPVMGPLQARVLGLSQDGGSPVEPEFGKGGIAAQAAREYMQNSAA